MCFGVGAGARHRLRLGGGKCLEVLVDEGRQVKVGTRRFFFVKFDDSPGGAARYLVDERLAIRVDAAELDERKELAERFIGRGLDGFGDAHRRRGGGAEQFERYFERIFIHVYIPLKRRAPSVSKVRAGDLKKQERIIDTVTKRRSL